MKAKGKSGAFNFRPFLFSFFGAAAGIGAAVYLPYGMWLCAAVAVASAALAFPLGRRRLPLIPVCAAVFAFVTVISFARYTGEDAESGKFMYIAASSVSRCGGYSVGYDEVVLEGEITAVGNSTVTVSDCEITSEGHTSSGTSVLVYGNALNDAEIGERVLISGTASPYGEFARNPGDSNTFYSAVADNISLTVNASEYTSLGKTNGMNVVFAKIKKSIYDILSERFDDSETANVTYATVTGDKTYISSDTREMFASSGASHLLAVSGLHTTVLLGVVCALFRSKRSGLRLIVITLFLICYTLFTGASPSVVRASLMAFLFALSSLFGARYDLLNSLGFAATVSLLLNPFRLFSLSFQLSFCAVFGICAYNFRRAQFVLRLRLFKRLIINRTVTLPQTVKTTLGATIGTLPVTLCAFGTVSLATIPANMLLIPLVTAGLSLTAVFLTAAALVPPAAVLLKLPYFIMRTALIAVGWAAKIPTVKEGAVNGIIIPVGIAVLLYFSRFCLLNKKKLTAVISAAALLVCGVFASAVSKNVLTLRVLCDKNTAVHINYGNKDFLICGENDSVVEEYAESNLLKIERRIITGETTRITSADGSDEFTSPYTFGDAVLSPVSGGILLEFSGHTVFVQTEEEFPEGRSFETVISVFGNACGDTVITYKTPSEECNAQYFTLFDGCVTVKIRGDRVRIKEFNKRTIG